MTMMIFTYQRTQKKVDVEQMRMLNFVIVELPTNVDVFDILSSGEKKARENTHKKKHNYIFLRLEKKQKKTRLRLIFHTETYSEIHFFLFLLLFFLLFACLRNTV